MQTAEGELETAVPQLRNTAKRFVAHVPPDYRTAMRTRPLETIFIGAYLRGLTDRKIESLVAEVGLGKRPKSTVSEICQHLRSKYQAFRARSLAEVELLVLFLDAIYLLFQPAGATEGVLVG